MSFRPYLSSTTSFAVALALAVASTTVLGPAAFAQGPLLMGAVSDDPSSDPLRVLRAPAVGLPAPQQIDVALPPGARAGASATFSPHYALVGDIVGDRVLVIDVEAASTVDTIPLAGYNGSGTIVITPDQRWALLASGFDLTTTLYVIEAPFRADSVVKTVHIPWHMPDWQAHAIAVDGAGRAFVYHFNGISVLDPPYETIAFTIAMSTNAGGGIAISPDGQTLLLTKMVTQGPFLGIVRAPFSAQSTEEVLPLPAAHRPSGVAIAPDNSFALVISYAQPELFRVSAPFTTTSAVEEIPISKDFPGFWTIALDPAGKLAVLGGNSLPPFDPYIFVQAPFTAAEATVHEVAPLGGFDRGLHEASFMPALVFGDGFESGDLDAWDHSVP